MIKKSDNKNIAVHSRFSSQPHTNRSLDLPTHKKRLRQQYRTLSLINPAHARNDKFYFSISYLYYFIIKQVKQALKGTNQYLRAVIISGVYALFWGIGIAGTGGEPGFALPAPNLIALGLMAYIGFYRGVVVGLCVVCFWWVVILIGMFIKLRYK